MMVVSGFCTDTMLIQWCLDDLDIMVLWFMVVSLNWFLFMMLIAPMLLGGANLSGDWFFWHGDITVLVLRPTVLLAYRCSYDCGPFLSSHVCWSFLPTVFLLYPYGLVQGCLSWASLIV
jgi:hypothetical protein